MKLETRLLTISELAEAAAVTPRTIRFYTLEGLLPPPDSRSRYALYTEEHLRRLRIIGRLKEAFFPLGKIREILEHYTQAQIEELLATLDAETAVETRVERAEADAKTQSAPPEAKKESASGQVAEVSAPPTSSAAEYIQRVLRTQKQVESPDMARRRATLREESSAGGLSPPMPPAGAPAVPVSAPPVPSQPAGAPAIREAAVSNATPEPTAPETWERIALLPGVELHIRFPTTPDVREYIHQVLAYTKSLRKPEV